MFHAMKMVQHIKKTIASSSHTHTRTRTHTHTHTTVLRPSWTLSGTIQVSWHQKGKIRKGKTNLDLLEQEIVSGSGIS